MARDLFRSQGNTNYYLDSHTGDDKNSGTSPQKPWKSLSRVNKTLFAPGDNILFKAGTKYTGRLCPLGSGNERQPILIDMYGEGTKPRIDGNGVYLETVLLYNQEYWEISNLEITNTGEKRVPKRAGVRIKIENFGTAHHIYLKNLFAHDVNGSNVKSEGGGYGIIWENLGATTRSRFHGLLIEACHILRTDRNGICGQSDFWQRSKWHPSLNVIIRYNLLEDIGGDGIVPIGADGCLIEYNKLDKGRQRCADHAAGIWPWSCDNTLIQFNEVSRMKGTKDGQGFDSDWNCNNSLFQYNYSHDNEGGFMLVCNNGDAGMNSICANTIIRYNISQNDRTRLFHIAGPVANTKIYNNVFYVGAQLDIWAVLSGDWAGFAKDTFFYNNIFYVDGKVNYDFGQSTNNVFERNVFYGDHQNQPQDSFAIAADPMLVNPGSGGEKLDSLEGYKLSPGSPCIGAGLLIEDNGVQDFWGNKLPKQGKFDIGAHQLSK